VADDLAQGAAPLAGRRILVTGASGGIGAAVARRVVADGAQVALLARRPDRLAELVSQLGAGATAVECDVTDQDALATAVIAAATAMDGIDALVVNAGAAHMGHVATGDPAVWRQVIELNLVSCLNTVRFGLDHVASVPADIVFIGSTAARRPMEATGIYSATKTGIAAAAESLRLELGPRGIRVCLLEPGRVDTDIGVNALIEAGGRHGSMGSDFDPLAATDVADVVGFVLSRPANLAMNAVVVRPVGQAGP
jgi:NADP-dependent 3-hydroxy acid dehydrogenase YdfG